jgi:hypothetical protein
MCWEVLEAQMTNVSCVEIVLGRYGQQVQQMKDILEQYLLPSSANSWETSSSRLLRGA